MRIIKKWPAALILVVLLIPAVAAHGGIFDKIDLGKELNKAISKGKELKKAVSKPAKKGTQPTESTAGKAPVYTSKTAPVKANNPAATGPTDGDSAAEVERKKLASEAAEGAAIFPQLPEEIQNRIMDESNLAHRKCSGGGSQWYYDCNCVKQEFINIRAGKGPEASFTTINRQALNLCFSPESIATYYYESCVTRHLSTKMKDRETYCKCFGQTMSDKFMERPALTSNYLAMLMEETRQECKFFDYLK